MAEAFLITLATLIIVLYGQTRLEARAIRRNRSNKEGRPLFLHPPKQ